MLPLEFRLLGCFLLGTVMASFLNLAIYRLASNSRGTSPWSRPPGGLPPRTLADRIPILGWLRLRREVGTWGDGFWIRPLLIELFFGIGVAALYWYEISNWGPFSGNTGLESLPLGSPPLGSCWTPLGESVVAGIFAGHVLLVCLMLVATFIDIDEKTIPDEVTVPGTLLGLLLVAFNPWILPPDSSREVAVGDQVYLDFMHLAAPQDWSGVFSSEPTYKALLLGTGCFWFWIFDLLPRNWYSRCGARRAVRYFFAGLVRSRFTAIMLAIGGLGTVGILAVWSWGGFHWAGLLTSLVGVASGAAMIWSVRLLGSWVLKKEAMGFGDVTLMAMIGSFIGWQATLIVFFLAPLAGLVVGVVQWALNRNNVVPYGPFLCLATLGILLFWPDLWDYLGPLFADLGKGLPLLLLFCLGLMVLLLILLQLAKRVFFGSS
jgi:prepilin signal peptidase PulO-like enzyme (type II secretory pathway)